jgi:hypothetical protein
MLRVGEVHELPGNDSGLRFHRQAEQTAGYDPQPLKKGRGTEVVLGDEDVAAFLHRLDREDAAGDATVDVQHLAA